MNEKKEDIVEIDFIYILSKIYEKKILIIFLSLIISVAVFFISTYLIKEKYVATTKIYVINNNNNNKELTTQDLQLGDYLVRDYKEIVLSNDVLDKVYETTGLEVNFKNIDVSILNGTRIIKIAVTNEIPGDAKILVDAIRDISIKRIKEVAKIDEVTILENSKLPVFSSYPNVKKNVALAFVSSFIFITLIIILISIVNDKIYYPKDIESHFEHPLLSVIPMVNKRK